MRHSIQGYTDAVLETAAAEGRVATVAEELTGLVSLLASSADLRSAILDPGIPAPRRRSVMTDLLAGRLGEDVVGLVAYVVDTDKAPEVVGDIRDLAVTARRAARPAPDAPPQPDMLGRTASQERLDGYATAVLAPLREGTALAQVEEDLFRFGRIVSGSEELTAVLTDREVPAERRASLVRDLLTGRARDASVRLAAYAARWGRPRDFVATVEWLVDRVAEEANRRVAEVRSAVELDQTQRQRLGAALARITGRPVEVRVTVDPELLGGFVAAVGETVVDGSARHRLDLLKERLTLPQPEITVSGPPDAAGRPNT